MEKRNFKIYEDGGKTVVDLTEEVKKYCNLKNRRFKNIMQYARMLQNHPNVKARTKASTLVITEEKATLTFDSAISAEVAYNVASVFIKWFTNAIDGYLISAKVMQAVIENKEP